MMMRHRTLLVLAVAGIALAACGKKPDFPMAGDGSGRPQRLYPDPTLDPGYKPPGPLPTPTATAPAPAPAPTPAPAAEKPPAPRSGG